MSPALLLLLPGIALLGGALLQVVLARWLTATVKGWLALLCSLVALGGVLALWPAILAGQVLDARLAAWDGPAALAYHVDGLSFLFALMAAGIGAAVLLYAVAYMAGEAAASRFYALMLIFIAGLIHLVYSADLLLLYAGWEVIGLCSFLLVGFWYRQPEAAAGARKVLVMTHLAGYGLLAAILLLYARTGSTLWTDPRVGAAFSSGLFLLVMVAALAKSVQFPLHTWIPDAMAAPTPVSALLHAACYVKAGVYLIARLHSLGPWPLSWQLLVIWVGTLTMLVGVLYALIQTDLKRLLAFHTVSQIGYMLLGLGLGTPLGVAAGLLHCLNHGLFKGGLFLCAGSVQQATGTRDMNRLGGLARAMPATTLLWLIQAGSIAGVPLLSGFVSKWLLYNAALEAGQPVPALVAWLVSVLTAFSFLKATGTVFLGEASPATERAAEVPLAMRVAGIIMAGGSLLVGIVPQVAVGYLINPLLPAMGLAPTIRVSWLGLATAGGSWFATGGLALAIVAVAAGGIIYWLAQPAGRWGLAGGRSVAVAGTGPAGGVFSGGEPLAAPARLPASDFSAMVHTGLAPFYAWADVDRYYLAVWQALLKLTQGLGRLSGWLEGRGMIALPVLSLGILLAALLAAARNPVMAGEVVSPAGPATWPFLAGTGLALLALILAVQVGPVSRRSLFLLAGSGLLAWLGLSSQQPLARLGLLELAALSAAALVWQTAATRAAARLYLLAVLLSIVATLTGTALISVYPALALALLLTGLALKLALVPLYLWLPPVAEAVPAAVVGLVVAVVDMAAFGELLALRQAAPWLFSPAAPWLGLAVLSALTGAGLMLAQSSLKRLLACSTIEDMGYLLLGVTLGGSLGLTGALAGATVHALAKALLFASLAEAEREGSPGLAQRGLASRYPLAGLGFLVGALAMLGVPPTAGYLARWRLYEAAAQAGPLWLAGLLLATGLAVLAYARAITLVWWGPPLPPGKTGLAAGSTGLALAILALSGLLLLAGLAPGWLAPWQ